VHVRGPREYDEALGRDAQRPAGGDGQHGDPVAVGVGGRVVRGQVRGEQRKQRDRGRTPVSRREGGWRHVS
jgi:hypothetical protein